MHHVFWTHWTSNLSLGLSGRFFKNFNFCCFAEHSQPDNLRKKLNFSPKLKAIIKKLEKILSTQKNIRKREGTKETGCGACDNWDGWYSSAFARSTNLVQRLATVGGVNVSPRWGGIYVPDVTVLSDESGQAYNSPFDVAVVYAVAPMYAAHLTQGFLDILRDMILNVFRMSLGFLLMFRF